MKLNKARGPTQPGRSNILQHVRNPQDIVQSHYLQVQSMFQETLAAGQHQHQQQQNKNDYFLGSSASETSMNDSLKGVHQDPELAMMISKKLLSLN